MLNHIQSSTLTYKLLYKLLYNFYIRVKFRNRSSSFSSLPQGLPRSACAKNKFPLNILTAHTTIKINHRHQLRNMHSHESYYYVFKLKIAIEKERNHMFLYNNCVWNHRKSTGSRRVRNLPYIKAAAPPRRTANATFVLTSGVAKPGPTRALAQAMLGRDRANIFIILKIWTRIWAKPPNYMSRLQSFIFSL